MNGFQKVVSASPPSLLKMSYSYSRGTNEPNACVRYRVSFTVSHQWAEPYVLSQRRRQDRVAVDQRQQQPAQQQHPAAAVRPGL